MRGAWGLRALLILVLLCAVGCAGASDTAGGRDSPHAMYRSEAMTILKSRRQWFDAAAFRREVSQKKQALREAGAPGQLIRQFDATLTRSRGLELAMAAEMERDAALFAKLGIILERGVALRIDGPGALLATLRDPRTGELVRVFDDGLLVRRLVGQESHYYDTAQGPLRFDESFQNPAPDTPSTVYARFAHGDADWEIVSVGLVDDRVQVLVDP